MRHYRDDAVLTDRLDPEETAIGLTGKFAVGKFVDVRKPTFSDLYEQCVVSRATAPKKKKEG